jgi:hypothetical protein
MPSSGSAKKQGYYIFRYAIFSHPSLVTASAYCLLQTWVIMIGFVMVHMGSTGSRWRSWILASTSNSDRLSLQSGELIIATTVQRSVDWDEQIRRVDGRSLHGWGINWKLLQHRVQYFKSEYKYIR